MGFNLYLVSEKDHAIIEWVDETNKFSVVPLNDVFLFDKDSTHKIDSIYQVKYGSSTHKGKMKISNFLIFKIIYFSLSQKLGRNVTYCSLKCALCRLWNLKKKIKEIEREKDWETKK